jgi:hypothetical protein
MVVLGVLGAGMALAVMGCASTPTTQSGASTKPAAKADPEASKGGAQLWAENCGRCHNIRSPSSYSDMQWDVAVHDMRVRANLTGEEQRKILEFLKSAN